ncbi:MAG: hypothetical protein P4L84_14130 [Isosphaeraceae bacterium]|nr:hypothetical protein [Isosphaeraceae bacterium]
MRRLLLTTLLGLLCCTRGALALEATGTLKKVDAEHGTLVVFAKGRDWRFKIADDAKLFGTDGKPLADGITSSALVPRRRANPRSESSR